tara:strand:+ start:960 stop:1214 length:255 start_codon:yes stop_codon:yes gene_type:complete
MINDRWRSLGLNTSKKFKIGDLVSWKLLGVGKGKNFGIIVDILEAMKGGRNIVFANVVCLRDSTTVSVPIMSLKKVSDNKTYEI